MALNVKQQIKKQGFETSQRKKKTERRDKNIHITNLITKFLVPSFNKYSTNEINTRYQQCRRQTKRSERALVEDGRGHYKMD